MNYTYTEMLIQYKSTKKVVKTVNVIQFMPIINIREYVKVEQSDHGKVGIIKGFRVNPRNPSLSCLITTG